MIDSLHSWGWCYSMINYNDDWTWYDNDLTQYGDDWTWYDTDWTQYVDYWTKYTPQCLIDPTNSLSWLLSWIKIKMRVAKLTVFNVIIMS